MDTTISSIVTETGLDDLKESITLGLPEGQYDVNKANTLKINAEKLSKNSQVNDEITKSLDLFSR